jgi:transglutaminase-like putative cysteine protease
VYLVNFDPDSLVALNYPVRVVPFRAWPDASFSRVYQVTSQVSRAGRLELVSVGQPRVGAGARGPNAPSGNERPDYTDYGDNEAIAELARAVTAGIDNPYEQVAAIEEHLRSEYYYSLSPGVASDGDQLMHFLFQSQKGYCSYFAFAMSLMVRSLDIPARVSVGFFVDPRLQVLDFHVIRADMAHAWVEVYFNEYGWIEFDPTSQTVAPGEDVELGGDVQVNEIAALLEEILQNRGELTPLETEPERGDASQGELTAFGAAARFAGRWWPLILAVLILGVLAGRHALLAGVARRDGSQRAVIRRYRRLLLVAGYLGWPRRRGESVLEHAQRLRRSVEAPMDAAADLYLAALFAGPGSLVQAASFAERAREVRLVLWRKAPWHARLRFLVFPFGRPAVRSDRPTSGRPSASPDRVSPAASERHAPTQMGGDS